MDRIRPGLLEWLALLLVVWAAIGFGAGHALLARIDRTLYDAALVLWSRPPPPNLATVVVDDASIAALGRWPWRRAVHATLVETIAAARPSAIVLDILVSEPDAADPRGDEALVRAVAAAGNVVVASAFTEVAGGGARDLPPIEPLRAAAAAVGHIGVAGDEDGVVRSIALRAGDPKPLPYLGLAALEVASRSSPGRAAASAPDFAAWSPGLAWPIPFYGPGPAVAQYSYLAVLRGDVPASAFAGRIVFIGAGATALGDQHPVPAGGSAAPMAGVEIAAQVAGGLQEGIAIRIGSSVQSGLVGAALALLLLVLYLHLDPRAALAATAGALILVLAGTFFAFRLLAVWLPPSSALLGIALCYPLWAWRRLEAALGYMRGELERLRSEPAGIPTSGQPTRHAGFTDPLEATIGSLRGAVADLRDARRFIADTVESLPLGLVVSDRAGRVVIANSRARDWAGGAASGGGVTLLGLLEAFRLGGGRTWQSVLDTAAAGGVSQAEAVGPGDRTVLVVVSPCYGASGNGVGLIANLLDITERRHAERRRDEVLRVLSHDMRAPLASIATLLEMRELDPSSLDTDTLLRRVGTFARRTLALADDFLRLARAEQAGPAQFAEVDLADVCAEACEEAWTLAHAKGVRIARALVDEPATVMGERDLLLRMLLNLLTNAIKFSPGGSTVTVSLEPQAISWLLRVSDPGCGIAREDIPRLFTQFGRVGSTKDDAEGVGLGLAMVRAVVERHRGVVSVSSEPGRGSVFSVSLPAVRHLASPGAAERQGSPAAQAPKAG